ncbi:MAG: Rad52/Rad22 family DNA repair protein [Lacisediminihabitans sp.]
MSEPRGAFAPEQVVKLLNPIKQNRVLADGKGHSHVSQQDITAHLIRMFGFGNFDIEVLNVEPIFEDQRANPKDGTLLNKWDVCYRALVRITIRNADGVTVAVYENGSTATAQNQSRGDGHDLAYKSAISLSIKRAAIALGDQFGLSLYNKGQLAPLVIATLVNGPHHDGDVQDSIPQQVSLGNDEIDRTEDDAPKPPENWRARVLAAVDVAGLSEIHGEAVAEGWATPELMAALTAQKGKI